MRSSAETHKRRREGCRDTPQSPSGDDRWTGKSTEELKAMLDRSQTQIDALQKKCTSQQKEIDGMEHDILKIYDLMLRCGSFEKVLREEWQYCAPPLPSSEGQDNGRGESAKALLGQKCSDLEARCSFLENTLDILKKEDDPPRPLNWRDWDDLAWQGFDEDYIVSVQKLWQLLSDATSQLMEDHGKYGKNICLDPYRNEEDPDEDDEEEFIFPHHGVLIPFWRQFADALQVQHFLSIETFSIRNIQLHPVILDILAPALRMKLVGGFDLGSNDLDLVDTGAGVDFFFQVTSNNPHIKRLSWEENSIENMNDVGHFADAVNCVRSLEGIGFRESSGGDMNGYDVLSSVISRNQRISLIDMSSCNIRTMGEAHVSDFLATNPPLTNLTLAHNHLTDEDALLIAGSLSQNTNLQCLELDGNEITDVGNGALANAVFDLSTLNSINDCNHTCFVSVTGLNSNFNNHKQITAHENKHRKLYCALSIRHRDKTNIRCLDAELGDDSLKLAHLVLGRVNSVATPRNTFLVGDGDGGPLLLSIMFEILRGWNMPELFEQSVAHLPQQLIKM